MPIDVTVVEGQDGHTKTKKNNNNKIHIFTATNNSDGNLQKCNLPPASLRRAEGDGVETHLSVYKLGPSKMNLTCRGLLLGMISRPPSYGKSKSTGG